MKFTATIITISDKGSAGLRVDESGPAIKAALQNDYLVGDIIVIPDEVKTIADTIIGQIDQHHVDLIITTGGTGITRRDVTPEATAMVIERELPGFAEIMRAESYKITPRGIISRGICGIRKESIVINLPGSPKAAVECLSFVIGALPHALEKLKDDTTDCAG